MVNPQPGNSHEPGYGRVNTGLLERDHIRQSSSLNTNQNKRILIVDDNFDTVFTLRIGLENSDTAIQVYTYDNPVNALLDFKPNFYDLLLIDVNMPPMDGFELCKKLLQKDINVKVCLSGFTITSHEDIKATCKLLHTEIQSIPPRVA